MNLQEHDELAALLAYDDLSEGNLLGYEIRPERVTLLLAIDLTSSPLAEATGLASGIVRVDFFKLHSIKNSLNLPVIPVCNDIEEYDADLGDIRRVSVEADDIEFPSPFRRRCEVEWHDGSIVLVYETVKVSAFPWPECDTQ